MTSPPGKLCVIRCDKHQVNTGFDGPDGSVRITLCGEVMSEDGLATILGGEFEFVSCREGGDACADHWRPVLVPKQEVSQES
jgi:hypothetical protein